MKLILQRVTNCSIVVDEKFVTKSEKSGILVFLGFEEGDKEELLPTALEKIINMRIFSNERGRFDLSLLDISGDLTLVPQFTLLADTSKGRRPEFFKALNPKEAKHLFEKLNSLAISRLGKDSVHYGIFGADMKISLLNDGPVTIPLSF